MVSGMSIITEAIFKNQRLGWARISAREGTGPVLRQEARSVRARWTPRDRAQRPMRGFHVRLVGMVPQGSVPLMKAGTLSRRFDERRTEAGGLGPPSAHHTQAPLRTLCIEEADWACGAST